MSRRAGFSILLAAAVVIVAVAVRDPGPGPLIGGTGAFATSMAVEPGVAFTYGNLALRNTGSTPATLESVALGGASPGLEIVGVTVTPVEGGPGVATAREYPPPGLAGRTLHGVRGFVVRPGRDDGREDAWVIIGMRVPRAGTYDVAGIDVTYRAGPARHRARYPHALRFCSPFTEGAECPIPDPSMS